MANSGGLGGAAKGLGSRGVQYVRGSSSRQTAFLLIVAIFIARLALTNQLQTFWTTLWSPSKPLGSALPGRVAAESAKSAKAAQNG